MMMKLMSVKDIQERYQVNPATARKYIREMIHMEKPLMVSEKEVDRWEKDRTVYPTSVIKQMRRRAIK